MSKLINPRGTVQPCNGWKTADGKFFETQTEAEAYALRYALEDALQKCLDYTSDAGELIGCLAKCGWTFTFTGEIK